MTHSMPINNSKWSLSWAVTLGALVLSQGQFSPAEDPVLPLSVRPEKQTAEWAIEWWMPRHEQKLKEKEQLKDCELVWIGDSITHGWEGEGKEIWDEKFSSFHPLNLGFSGDRTEHVLWRLEHGAVEGLSPKVVVLMIGTNNAGHRKEPSAETAQGVRAIVGDLKKRLPDSKILVLAIFPRGDGEADELRQLCNETNAQISKLADGERVLFLDINKEFLDANGDLPADVMPDKLHPNRRGYEIWAKAIDKKLNELLSPK
jgi:beta-glucosidase